MIGLFCKRAPYKWLYSAKETYSFEEPSNHREPIANSTLSGAYSRSLLQNIVSCIGLFCNRDLSWPIQTALYRAHAWHGSFTCVAWLSCVWHDSFIRVPWLIYVCDMTYSYTWHDLITCVTWLVHMCDMTHYQLQMPSLNKSSRCEVTRSHVWRDSFKYVTWLIHMCAMIHYQLQITILNTPSRCDMTQLIHMC